MALLLAMLAGVIGSSAASPTLVAADVSTFVEPQRHEIVFVDTTVDDYEALLAGIDPSAQIVMLDADRDGVEQIAEVLAPFGDVDAVHIVSHGDETKVFLGNSSLTLNSMRGEYADELASIGESLSEGANILFYGCKLGRGEAGRAAAVRLAALTSADIAASDDDTGHVSLGGDWELEVTAKPDRSSLTPSPVHGRVAE